MFSAIRVFNLLLDTGKVQGINTKRKQGSQFRKYIKGLTCHVRENRKSRAGTSGTGASRHPLEKGTKCLRLGSKDWAVGNLCHTPRHVMPAQCEGTQCASLSTAGSEVNRVSQPQTLGWNHGFSVGLPVKPGMMEHLFQSIAEFSNHKDCGLTDHETHGTDFHMVGALSELHLSYAE